MEKLNPASFRKKVFDFETAREWKFEGERPAIIDFYADWCGPCRALAPILEGVAADYAGKVDIYKVDTEAHPDLAALFGVRGIPALLFVPLTGKPTMATGLLPRPTLDQAIEEVLKVERKAS